MCYQNKGIHKSLRQKASIKARVSSILRIKTKAGKLNRLILISTLIKTDYNINLNKNRKLIYKNNTSVMACPFFTTVKMITALMILFFTLMQVMSFKKKYQTINSKELHADDKSNDDIKTTEEPSNVREQAEYIQTSVN